ncbi:SDR family NAD(P)-dependent oxidoreductase [Luteococcus sp.]|uniref:SDR family NAD(P)-dependent oxidoreductase n=1 Tax=Luteococcus sp. TaxID=1969402 RepID=UPI0037368601
MTTQPGPVQPGPVRPGRPLPGRPSDDAFGPGIDPDDMATTLRVLDELAALELEHPDQIAFKQAVNRMNRAIRARRRRAVRQPTIDADNEVLARTATASPQRIDDETAGIPLVSTATGAIAGHLNEPRGCYICKGEYTQVDAFYHDLCPECAAFNHTKRNQRCDLTGRRALLTGGRAKIGMYIALRLLRDGAALTITTRFPHDAARRFRQMPDSDEWIDRLQIVGIDLRDPTQVVALADEVAQAGPLDILINNAAQTVRRSPGAYSHLVEGEKAALPTDRPMPRMLTFDHISEAHPAALVGAGGSLSAALASQSAAELAAQALTAGNASLERHLAGTAIDAGGLLPDLARENSWTKTVDLVDPLEMLEAQLCNATAPFILISRLRAAMAASPARRTYVVNVSAMEGQFGRRYKGAGHPHTNMAKAALNMLTRTSAQEMFETDQILMTAVDTGWITDERPHDEKLRIAQEGWHAPLDLVDGAARVLDPIWQGEQGVDLYGVFLKDYKPFPW